jgi:hypothetical protein
MCIEVYGLSWACATEAGEGSPPKKPKKSFLKNKAIVGAFIGPTHQAAILSA